MTFAYPVRQGSIVRSLPDSSLFQVLVAQSDEALCDSPCAVLVFRQREGVLNSAPCSVLISRGRGRRAPRERARGLRVLLAVDESEHALAAARLLRALNVPATSQVTVLHVVEPPDDRILHLLTTTAPKFREAAQALIRVTKERGKQVLERVRKVVTYRGLTVHPLLVEGRPAEEIIRAAERTHADLVLLGSRGMTGLKGAFLVKRISHARIQTHRFRPALHAPRTTFHARERRIRDCNRSPHE